MAAVLYLDSVRRPTRSVGAIAPLGDQSLRPELAALPEGVRADLTLLEIAGEDAFRPSRQEPSQIVPSEVQGQLPYP
jgi:hypothetical protein